MERFLGGGRPRPLVIGRGGGGFVFRRPRGPPAKKINTQRGGLGPPSPPGPPRGWAGGGGKDPPPPPRGPPFFPPQPRGLGLTATDEGPGIPDVAMAMQEGYSTASASIREMGFGAGMGLPNIKRHADGLAIETKVGEGTTLKAWINCKKG